MDSHLSRCRGTLLGAFCGDALGARAEGATAAEVARRYPAGLTAMRGHGRYTDDFQASAAPRAWRPSPGARRSSGARSFSAPRSHTSTGR